MKRFMITCLSVLAVISIFGCNLSARMGGGWPFRKTHSINSQYYGEFLQVYCEHDFDFQKAGCIKGTFALSKYVDYKTLRIQILIPALFRDTPWSGHFLIPGTLELNWDGGNCQEIVTDDRSHWAFLSFSPYQFEQRLPVDKTISYTFTYSAGSYKDPAYIGTGLSYYDREHNAYIDKTEDIEKNPEKYPQLWQAKFMVVEARRKGD